MVRIQVEALDRQHLLSDVTRVLAAPRREHPCPAPRRPAPIAWRSASSASRWPTPQHLNRLLAAVRKIDGVFDVYRVTGAKDSAVPRLRKMQ